MNTPSNTQRPEQAAAVPAVPAAREAAAPTAVLVNPVRRTVRQLWLLALAALVATVIVEVWSIVPRGAGMGVGGGATLVFALTALLFRYGAVPQGDRNLEELRRGQYLAHWTYEPAAWQRFAATAWRHFTATNGCHSPRKSLGMLIGGLALGLGCAAFAWWGGAVVWDSDVFLYPCCLAFVLCFIGGVLTFLYWRYRRALWTAGEVYIGRQAVYVPGRRDLWAGLAACGSRLDSIRLLDGRPPVLECAVWYEAPGWTETVREVSQVRGQQIRSMSVRSAFCFPVPPGRESEARAVVTEGRLLIWTEAIRREPDNGEPYLHRGDTWLLKGDHEKAIADYSEAIQKGRDADGYLKRGDAHARRGDAEQARADYDRAVAVCTEKLTEMMDVGKGFPVVAKAEVYLKRATAWERVRETARARADYELAVATSTEAIQLVPEDAAPYLTRAAAHAHLGDHPQAKADRERAAKLKPALAGGLPR
jgi:hypothetical protein